MLSLQHIFSSRGRWTSVHSKLVHCSPQVIQTSANVSQSTEILQAFFEESEIRRDKSAVKIIMMMSDSYFKLGTRIKSCLCFVEFEVSRCRNWRATNMSKKFHWKVKNLKLKFTLTLQGNPGLNHPTQVCTAPFMFPLHTRAERVRAQARARTIEFTIVLVEKGRTATYFYIRGSVSSLYFLLLAPIVTDYWLAQKSSYDRLQTKKYTWVPGTPQNKKRTEAIRRIFRQYVPVLWTAIICHS